MFRLQQHRCPHGGVTAEALPQAAAGASGSLQLLPGLPALWSAAADRPLSGNYAARKQGVCTVL